MFRLCHSFRGFIGYLYVVLLSYILFRGHTLYLIFSVFTFKSPSLLVTNSNASAFLFVLYTYSLSKSTSSASSKPGVNNSWCTAPLYSHFSQVCYKWRNFEAVLLPVHNILLLTHVSFIKFNSFVKIVCGGKMHFPF